MGICKRCIILDKDIQYMLYYKQISKAPTYYISGQLLSKTSYQAISKAVEQ